MTTLITNIKQLVGIRSTDRYNGEALRGKELADLPTIEDAYLIIEDGVIAEYGSMNSIQPRYLSGPKSKIKNPKSNPDGYRDKNPVNASGQIVLPCWCDSHTHLVFAASREEEFVDKVKGMSYAEIAAKGGGILNSARKLNDASEDQLFSAAWKRLEEVSKLGTGAIEIKSGYGLSVEGELKMLRVIKKIKERSNLSIRSTFLGAHAYPPEFKEDHQGYIDCIVNEMLPVIGKEKLADYIDVFCESGFFSPEEMDMVCKAGMSHGLKPKLHVNQLNSIGGIEAGIKLNALSLDHLEILTENEIVQLSNSGAIGTLLPTAAFFLRVSFPPARRLIDAGCAVALASDYNPGSSPSGNMNLVVSMACIQMKMLPEEAINAATVNGACAMELKNEAGSIDVGKKANLIFTKPVPSLAYIPYAFGTNSIDKVMINGEFV
jgi:imidazolonepropionase